MAGDPEWASPIHGQVQWLLAVYDRRRGWLTIKGSIVKGGHHGEPALIDHPQIEIEQILEIEIRQGVRAMKKRWAGE